MQVPDEIEIQYFPLRVLALGTREAICVLQKDRTPKKQARLER